MKIPEEEEVEEEEETKKEEKNYKGLDKILIDVEKLKAVIEAIKEERKAYMERFSQINESIGDLRRTLIEKEKQLNELEASVAKTLDVVKEVDPEGFLVALKKQEAHMDAIKVKIESLEEMINTLVEQVKDINNRMSLFRGTEQLMKLIEEGNQTYKRIKEMEANIEKRGDKVESIFVEMNKQFKLLQELKEKNESMEKALAEISKSIENLKTSSASYVKREEIENLKKEVDEKLKEMDKIVSSIQNPQEVIEKISQMQRSVEEEKEKALTEINNKLAAVSDIINLKREIGEKMAELEDKRREIIEELKNVLEIKNEILELLELDREILAEIARKEKLLEEKNWLEEKINSVINRKKIKLNEREVESLKELLKERFRERLLYQT